jgi:hypothetical protein
MLGILFQIAPKDSARLLSGNSQERHSDHVERLDETRASRVATAHAVPKLLLGQCLDRATLELRISTSRLSQNVF